MHSAYTIGAPSVAQINGSAFRYDAFSVGQEQPHTAGAHASYLGQPAGVPHTQYHNIGHQNESMHPAAQAQQQNYRGGFVGPRRRYPNQTTSESVSYPQPYRSTMVQIPCSNNQLNTYGGPHQNRSRGPLVVLPPTCTTSFYPEHPRYSGGFTFKLFNDERTHFIHLPSQYVLITEGSGRYLSSSKPEQMAPRFTLCRHILQDRVCPRGILCNFIHGILRAAEGDPAFRRIEVHKNDAMETGTTRYELLPEGTNMIVAYPSEERSVIIPSQNVYKTRGSELYLRILPEGAPQKVPQRCSHYHFKKMCHRGALCSFIHIAYDTGMLALVQNGNPENGSSEGMLGDNNMQH